MPYPGATLNVWNNSGKTVLIGTGNTDASGDVSVDIPSAGTYYIELVSNSVRFNGGAATTAVTCNQVLSGFPFVLSIAAGYVTCVPGCLYPVKSTLHTSQGSPCTLMTWSGGGLIQWANICFHLNSDMTCGDPSSNPCTATLTSCPPSFAVTMVDNGVTIFITE